MLKKAFLFLTPLILAYLSLFFLNPQADAKTVRKSKLPEAFQDLAETAAAMSSPAREIAAQAAVGAKKETERQVELLAGAADRESQEAAVRAAETRRRLADFDQKAESDTGKGAAWKRKELKSLVEKAGDLAESASRAAGRVSGGAKEALRRATLSLDENPDRLANQTAGAIQDVRDYFGFLSNHPWKFNAEKSQRMINGLIDQFNTIVRGTSLALTQSTRPLLAAMEADLRTIHDQKKEEDRLLARADAVGKAASVPDAAQTPGATPVLSEEGHRDPAGYIPKFDTERLQRKLMASHGDKIRSLRASLQGKLKAIERQFEKERPTAPSKDSFSGPDDPEPTPKVLK